MPGAQRCSCSRIRISASERPTGQRPISVSQFKRRIFQPAGACGGRKFLTVLSKLPEITDVSSDQQNSGTFRKRGDRPRHRFPPWASRHRRWTSALYDAFGQRQVSTMYKSINQYHVVLALEQKWWSTPEVLSTRFTCRLRGALKCPISTFAHWSEGVTPLAIPHQGQFPASTLSFNLAPDGISTQRRRWSCN